MVHVQDTLPLGQHVHFERTVLLRRVLSVSVCVCVWRVFCVCAVFCDDDDGSVVHLLSPADQDD